MSDDTALTPPLIYTIGHSTHSEAEFVDVLDAGDVAILVDVRSFPGSRRNPQFSRESLATWLPRSGIDYAHIGALGGFRHSPAGFDSPNAGWTNASFRAYADYMQTAAFADGLQQLEALAGAKLTCFMCSEAPWWRCHRRLIADALLAGGWSVWHLGLGRPREHELTSFALVDGVRITYPPAQLSIG